MKTLLIRCIKFYQRNISPYKHYSRCRFTPTCSEYAVGALEKYGFFKGSLLALWRLLRCNPFCEGGFDPVP